MIKLENRVDNVLDLKELYEEDKKTVAYALNVIANLKGRKLNKEEVQKIYNQGIKLSFIGNAPLKTKEENYVLFYPTNISKEMPARLKVKCDFSRLNHLGITDKNWGTPIIAGILNDDRFDSFSSTWLKEAPYRSPAYNLGEAINKIMLKHFQLD